MSAYAPQVVSGWGNRLAGGTVAHFYEAGASVCGLVEGYEANVASGGRSGTVPDDACSICLRKLAGEPDAFVVRAQILTDEDAALANRILGQVGEGGFGIGDAPIETTREPDVVDPPAPSSPVNPAPEVEPPAPVEPAEPPKKAATRKSTKPDA